MKHRQQPKRAATEVVTVVTKDPVQERGALKHIGGSANDDWNNLLANQAIQALSLKNSDPGTRDRQLRATIAALAGIEPKDELEGMMAAQLIAAHNATMECYRRAMHSEQTLEGRRESLSQANKLSRTYALLLDALNRHRGKGQQKVTVEHVHVHSGGQAVVGLVATPGRGSPKDRGTTPRKPACPCTAALVAEPRPGAGPRADPRRWRTAAAACTEDHRQGRRWGIRTPSNMVGIPETLSPAVE